MGLRHPVRVSISEMYVFVNACMCTCMCMYIFGFRVRVSTADMYALHVRVCVVYWYMPVSHGLYRCAYTQGFRVEGLCFRVYGINLWNARVRECMYVYVYVYFRVEDTCIDIWNVGVCECTYVYVYVYCILRFRKRVSISEIYVYLNARMCMRMCIVFLCLGYVYRSSEMYVYDNTCMCTCMCIVYLGLGYMYRSLKCTCMWMHVCVCVCVLYFWV